MAPLRFGRYSRYELGGLRGGFTIAKRGALDLREAVVFKGKRVSGRVSAAGKGTLTVNGGAPFTVRRFSVRAARR